MRRRTAVAAVIALATALAACGGGDGGSGNGGDSSGGGIKQGGTYTAIVDQTDESAPLNPFAAPTNSHPSINTMSLAYAKNSLTDPNTFYPGAVEAFEVSEDGNTVTATLADGAKWSDGEPMTSKDLEFSYKVAYTQATGAFQLDPGSAGAVGEVKVVDDRTVEFSQDPKNAVNTFPRGIADVILLPEHVWGEVLPADFDATLEAALGDGNDAAAAREAIAKIGEDVLAFDPGDEDVSGAPFVFERATPSDVLFKKNENFYAADKVAPDNFVVKNYTGNQQVWDFVNAGEVDSTIFTATPPDIMKGFESNSNVGIHDSYSAVVAGWAFNQSKAPYDDLSVRKALAHAVDRDEAIEVGTPTAGYAPLTTTGMHSKAFAEWQGTDDIEELGLDPYEYDQAKAEQYLTDAGFTKEGDQWMLPNGKPWKLTFQVVNGFTDWIAVAENVVTQLEEFGIDAQTKTSADFDVYQLDIAEGKYDMGFWLLGISPSPYDVYQRIYGVSNGWSVLGNSMNYSPPGENGNWMGGAETYDLDGETVNPGELTASLRTGPLDGKAEDILKLAKITNQNLPVIQFWDYSSTWFYTNSNYSGFEDMPEDAHRLRPGVWLAQGWLSAK